MFMSVMSLMWILIRMEVADLDPGGKKSPRMRQTSAENSKKNCIKLAIKFKIYFIKAKCKLIKKKSYISFVKFVRLFSYFQATFVHLDQDSYGGHTDP